VENRPVVLALVTPGDMPIPMVVGTDTVTDAIIRLAGGRSAAEILEVEGMGLRDAEQIILADPEHILLIDYAGRGEAAFEWFLRFPGMETLKAVQNEHVYLLPAKSTMVSSNSAMDGLEQIARLLYPDLFEE
jgi:iron complex transport system substrate-binding protein